MSHGARRPRTFQCREQFWEAFDVAAAELGVPVDDLLDDAMLAYAKMRGHLQDEPGPPRRTPNPGRPPQYPVPRIASSLPPPPAPPSRRMPPPPTRGPLPGMGPGMGAGMPAGMPRNMPQTAPLVRPVARAARLLLTYDGQSFEADKERFILGRSKQQADLRLADANVSREHAAIERVGATWYVVDLGSTNGVHVNGEPVSRRALADGDVIGITTHEIFCALR